MGIWKCKQSFVRQFKTAGVLVKHDGSIHGVTLDINATAPATSLTHRNSAGGLKINAE
jgi:hypothetical protein